MTSEEEKLCSVHYTPDILDKVETELKHLSKDVELEYGFPRGEGLMTAGSANEMLSNILSTEVTTFYIMANSEKGSLILSAVGTGKDAEHRLLVEGEKQWRNAAIRGVRKTVKAHESSRFRSLFHSKYIGYVQSILIWSLVFWNIRYFWPVLGIPYYVDMPLTVVLLSGIGILTIVGLEGLDRLYPYVSIRRDGGPSRLYKILAHLAMIGSIVGLLVVLFKFIDLFLSATL